MSDVEKKTVQIDLELDTKIVDMDIDILKD